MTAIDETNAKGANNITRSWAVWVSVVLVILLVLGILWAYRRDKRDEINYDLIRNDKTKMYVGLYIDPIEPVRKN